MGTIAIPPRRSLPDDPTHYLHERYRGARRRSPLLAPYYALKPLAPRPLQLRLRRAYARRQASRSFPAWPIEPILVDHQHAQLKERMRAEGVERLPLVSFWPRRHRYACILTHDVEGSPGVENIERVREVERRYGFVSSWNFVGDSYPIPEGTFARLRAEGCEIGLHGIKHDGKLFSSRARFERELPLIHDCLERWNVVGFRSPATHRRTEWMHELGCLYDSSFPDTDPFEPMWGGCCSIFPFLLRDLVELPITLVQDHTLMEILRHRDIGLWRDKSEWIIANHGLINLITHPDYLIDDAHLRMYETFLRFLAAQPHGWHALPREVARWWRTREGMSCASTPDGVAVTGDPTDSATVAWATENGGRLVIEF